MCGLFDDIFGKKSKKQRLRENLENNKRKGKAAEDRFVMEKTFEGKEVVRTGRGSDYRVRERDFFTGKVKSSRLYEVKATRKAPVSKLQKKGVKKKRVTVKRYNDDTFHW